MGAIPSPRFASGVSAPQYTVETAAADGAIASLAGGIVKITKGTAAALTLAAPTYDGAHLIITSDTAAAHTVTVTGGAGGSGQDLGTFGGAINDSCQLVSAGGEWHVISTRNVTFA